MLKKIATMIFITSFATTVSAYDLTNKFGLGISGGYSTPVFGNNFNSSSDADFGYGIHARYHFSSSMNLELGVSRSEFIDTNVQFDNLNLLGVWRMGGANHFSPVLGLGVGTTRIKNFAPSSLKLTGLARLGAEYSVTQWFSIALMADYQYVSKLMGKMPTGRAHVVTPQLALTWYFGGENSKPASVVPTKDADVTAPAQNFVDESQLDSDDDGVKDPEDRCPSTPKGTKVNTLGCGVEEKATMEINVEFSSGKAVLASKYNAHIKEVAAFLVKYPEVNVQIEGYTDNKGSAAKNIALSEQRAKAVMNALVKAGVAKTRLTAKGFGPENPIQDNNTAEGRQANRRVVAVLSSK